MTLPSFGLPNSDQAAAQRVRDQLDANDQVLMDIAQSMANWVRGRLNDNSEKLARVDKRIRQSVNGHLRKNEGLLRPIVAGLNQAVQNALSNQQAMVNIIASRPEVQQWLADNPPNPAWAGTVPDPPQPGDLGAQDVQPLPHGLPPQPRPEPVPGQPPLPPAPGPTPTPPVPTPAPAPPSPPPGILPPSLIRYFIFFHCRERLLAAVPNSTPIMEQALAQEGWQPWQVVPFVDLAGPAEATTYLQSITSLVEPLCHV